MTPFGRKQPLGPTWVLSTPKIYIYISIYFYIYIYWLQVCKSVLVTFTKWSHAPNIEYPSVSPCIPQFSPQTMDLCILGHPSTSRLVCWLVLSLISPTQKGRSNTDIDELNVLDQKLNHQPGPVVHAWWAVWASSSGQKCSKSLQILGLVWVRAWSVGRCPIFADHF